MSGSRYNESKYSFLDTSGWPSVQRARDFWEAWFDEYPDDKKSALAARFQSQDDHPHLSAFLELFTFAVLRQSGYDLAVEPPAGDLALEFLAHNPADEPRFYVECTATGRHRSQVGADALEADLLEAINKTPTDRFLLEIEVETRGGAAPATKTLRPQLAEWLASLDVDEVTANLEEEGRFPEWIWEKDGWRVRFGAMPTIASADDGEGAVGMTLASFVPDQHIRLRAAMDGKASKYGELGRPLLLVLGSTQFQSDRDLMTALLGDVQWHINFATKAVTTGRKPNGVLYDAKGPRNVAMSAVMHGHIDALSFAAKDRPMTLTHHPFAAYVLERGLFPFCEERYFDAATGELVTVPPAISVQEFFGLEAGWPHFDRDGR